MGKGAILLPLIVKNKSLNTINREWNTSVENAFDENKDRTAGRAPVIGMGPMS